MLDYNLVSSLATYRMPKPEDIPVLVDMVERFHAETRTGLNVGQAEVLATLKELNQDRRAGSWFVFEKDEEVVGYCLIANRWSNRLRGAVLLVDELYVMPGRRGRGFASDFLGLLAKVAPGDAAAIQFELPPDNRRAHCTAATARFRGSEGQGDETALAGGREPGEARALTSPERHR